MDNVQNEPQDQPVEQASDATPVENVQVQEGTATDSGAAANPEAIEKDTHDTPDEGNDSVDNLPKATTESEKAMLKRMHQATQQAAEYRRYAEAYHQITNHPEFKEFLQWQETRQSQPAQPTAPQVQELSEEEFLAAQANPAKFNQLLQNRVQSTIAPIVQQGLAEINRLKNELELGKKERELEAFTQVHPDFWDIDPRIMKATLEDVVLNRKGTLSDAYQQAKALEKQYLDKAQASIKQRVAQKKQAVTASPSKASEPEVIYVENENEANRVAFQAAVNGKRVDVRVRRK
jgi:hypothetical protein